MPLPEDFDLVIHRGKPYLYEMEHTEDDEGEVPLDLSDETVEGHLRTAPGADLAAEFTVDMTQADVGLIALTLTEEETAAMTETRYRYDVFTETGEILGRGSATMIDPVTQ